jgi:putative polyketide hydroxylase
MERLPLDKVDVLVVGGGVAGLAAGFALGELGISALVVERRPDWSSHPRATALTAATMELFRQWGVEPQVREAGFISLPAMSLRPSLVGPELQRIPFPEHVWTCAQDRLEPILCRRTRSAGTPVVYGWELSALQVGEDGVRTTMLEPSTGASREVPARFVVGADGASSAVRRAAGIGMSRLRAYGEYLSILFQAPLRNLTGDPPCMVYGITNTDPLGVLVPTDAADRWIRGVPWHSETGGSGATFDTESCMAIVRAAVGSASVPVSILATQSFAMAAGLADRFRVGRVLLAGDAAHIFSPSTGMGLNLAIEDGVSVARYLAEAQKSGGSLEALDAYETERKPIAERLLAAELAA